MAGPFFMVAFARIGDQAIERTHDTATTAIEHVRVDHRRADVRMTQQLLHRSDVVPRFEQMVANECRSVCGVAGLAMPPLRNASRIARWKDWSLM